MSTRIFVRITPDGQTEVSVAGVQGTDCQEATRSLEQKLGNVISDTATDEMYNKAGDTQGETRENSN
jgi:hypothetical protein